MLEDSFNMGRRSLVIHLWKLILSQSRNISGRDTLQVVRGNLTTQAFGPPIQDDSGLKQWCGTTFIGKTDQKFSVLSGYRTFGGSLQTAPLGSTLCREYEHFKEKGTPSPQPRSSFLKDMWRIVHQLQSQDCGILLMMDANSTIDNDKLLQDFIAEHELMIYTNALRHHQRL
jgi:hypothetical protein